MADAFNGTEEGSPFSNTTAGDSSDFGANATTTATFTTLFNDATLFFQKVQVDPLEAVKELPHVVLLIAVALLLPSLVVGSYKTLFGGRKKSALSSWDQQDETEKLVEAAQGAEQTEAVWEIGVSARAVAVAEEGVLRAFESNSDGSKPTAEQICDNLLKAIAAPTEGVFPVEKPRVAAFLQSRQCTDAVISKVAKRMKEFGVRVTSIEELGPEMEELMNKRKEEIMKKGTAAAKGQLNQMMAAQAGGVQADGPKPEFLAQPSRACFTCHKEIPGKASQCSACRAIIYCGAECAKKDWPNHKQMCQSFKANMQRIEKEHLHDLPFTYYNSKTQLANYNQVTFLVHHNVHNVGVYRRLCGCYQEQPYGELVGEQIALLQANNITDAAARFSLLGLSMDLYPLSKPFGEGVDVRKLSSWKDFYEARGLQMNNPAALVLEVPLTVWHLINKFVLDKIETKPDGRRYITIHLLGAEKEADLTPLFELLLAFLPKTDIAIHMIGPALSERLRPEHATLGIRNETLDSTMLVTLRSGLYTPEHHTGAAYRAEGLPMGTDKPDLVIAMNAALFATPTWSHTLQYLIQSKQRMAFTETMEQNVEVVKKNLAMIGAGLSAGPVVNPFRQPVWQYKRETNLPGWSNGFVFAMFT
ncbi:hypothetical protein HK104_007993 [Borealophlyctis nickersoniae]|nr:hypothetical protein HK104_007993 [Borealophlyctis nickersoniae]